LAGVRKQLVISTRIKQNTPDMTVKPADEVSRLMLITTADLPEPKALAEQVGEAKSARRNLFFRPRQVAQATKRIRSGPTRALQMNTYAVWREIMSACLALVSSPVRVVYLGPAGTFSEEAQFFSAPAEHVACTSFDGS
jgi:hypothetical protein